ncbi:biotin biosynthesis protein BioC [Kluyvera cryocrescens]|uniref:Biotin biosynthesis protein BioC n=1 Tax=Kluyvera cryocrescens TaxID=580 RepID=A0A485BWG9_KLUCR|nr:biotin biosynthesis protein BioC [Kluyvera cryocrescens]
MTMPISSPDTPRLDRSVKGLDGAPEWPAIQQILPTMRDLRAVDLGCGYGWFCRWARDQGAAQITGLDLSQRMLERAREMTRRRRHRVPPRRFTGPQPTANSCDLVYSSLTLHYLPDIAPLAGPTSTRH